MREATRKSAAPTPYLRRTHAPKVDAHNASARSAPRASPPVPRRSLSARNHPLPSARSRRRARIREGSAARSGEAARTDGAWAAKDQDRLISYGPFDYTYTANGELETKTNRDTDEEWIFDYDELGNLLTVGLPNGDLVEYLVDGMGRRVGKKKNGVLLKQWIYRDTLKPVAELDGSGALVAEFVYGSKSNVPDYVRRGGATYRVVSDQLGSPRYVVNVSNSAEVPFTASYTSFGAVTGTGLDWMPFGFAGGIYDGDSGLVRFGLRDFEPATGRWTRRDPILLDGDINVYGYAGADPVNNVDPLGLDRVPITGDPSVPMRLTEGLWGLLSNLLGNNYFGSANDNDDEPPANDNDCGRIRQECRDDCIKKVLEAPGCGDKGPDYQRCYQGCVRPRGC